MSELLHHWPLLTSLLLVGIAWGRVGPSLDDLRKGQAAAEAQAKSLADEVKAVGTDVGELRKAQAVATERETQHRKELDALVARDREHDEQLAALRKEIADSRHELRREFQTAISASFLGNKGARTRRG